MNNLEFAITMELDGEKYYREQAEKNQGNSLNRVFMMLARDEENHARVLLKRRDEQTYALEDNDIVAESHNVFVGIGELKTDLRQEPNQLDAYEAALDMERKSISLYEELLSEACNDEDKALLKYLVKQEKDHFAVLEELVILLRRPEQWVESAEFGRRKEY